MTSVFAVPSHKIDDWWEELGPHLERFHLETQRTDAETIRRQAKALERQLWAVSSNLRVTGVLVTELYETNSGRVCWIWATAGSESEPGDMKKVYLEIEKWARAVKCVSIGINGRKGWLRVLPGFKQTAVVIEKDLRNAS